MRVTPERERVEELAEEIWSLAEIGENSHERLVGGSKIGDPEAVLAAMTEAGLARRIQGKVELTEAGSDIARTVVRRHRLAEVLLSQVLEIAEPATEATACDIEHLLSAEVTDSVCTFLGHPPHCPHGKPIPRGRCCETLAREMVPLVSRLLDLGVGETARIVYITPQSRRSLDRIATLGIVPGARVGLKQKSPALVLEVGQTLVALDREIGSEIYIRRILKEAGAY